MDNELNASKTFAEEALDMLSTHPGSRLSIFFSDWGALEIQMREHSKEKGSIGANEIIGSDLFASKLTVDELMVYAIQHLRKELDKYGRK